VQPLNQPARYRVIGALGRQLRELPGRLSRLAVDQSESRAVTRAPVGWEAGKWAPTALRHSTNQHLRCVLKPAVEKQVGDLGLLLHVVGEREVSCATLPTSIMRSGLN
jgi:hypothetical protein